MRERFGSASAITTLIALSLSTFIYVTTETLPIGLLPLIAKDLGTTTSAIGLLVTGYGLVVVLASIPLTRLTRRLPRRQLLCILLSMFVVTTCLSALAPNYWLLMGARMVTALSQALFWAVVTPTAAGLFRAKIRGRAISILYAGSSIAALAGVPLGTWLGQQTNWRVAFFVLSGIGLLILVTIAALLPNTRAGQGAADRGSAPDRGRYWSIAAATALAVTGAFTAFTYINPFLTDVSGFSESSIGPLLLVRGLAGLAGVIIVGFIINRYGWQVMIALMGLQAAALAGQYTLDDSQIATVITISVSGFTLAALSAALGARVLAVAPGGTDMAGAGTSTAFNIGITAGALFGSVLLSGAGVRSTALVGALITLVALAVVIAEPVFSSRRHVMPAAAEAARQDARPRTPTSSRSAGGDVLAVMWRRCDATAPRASQPGGGPGRATQRIAQLGLFHPDHAEARRPRPDHSEDRRDHHGR
jgi:DHA1 family inner membrane transport protein